MAHLIEVKNLRTEFKQEKGTLKAVNGVSYYVDEGEIVAFVGKAAAASQSPSIPAFSLFPARQGK